MNPFHILQSLVAVLIILNVLDVITTSYAIRMKIAREENSIVLAAMHWVGTTWGGLLLIKVPGFIGAGMAMFPQFFAALGTPNWLLVWNAETPTWSWLAQISFYAIIIANNIRVCWKHVMKGKA